MKIIGIIPARYASTRFPGKPLADINGKAMIQRVYEQSAKATSLDKVIVATDDERIAACVEGFDGFVEMTESTHQNGTERCAEVATRNAADYYINIQGDEPFIQPGQIDTLAAILDGKTELGTLVKKVEDDGMLDRPGVMKVVLNNRMEAMYFSRSCIPFVRDSRRKDWLQAHTFYKHIGIYAYRADVLGEITQLPKSSLEEAENLEQLRWLENGYTIKVAETTFESMGVDTPEDLERVLSPS